MSNRFVHWFLTTSTIVGIPLLLFIIAVGTERSIATLTCETAKVNCSRSFLSSVEWIAEQVDQDTDVVVAPKRRKG